GGLRAPSRGPSHGLREGGGAAVASGLGAPPVHPPSEEPPAREKRGEHRDQVLPARAHPNPMSFPRWKTAREAIQASPFIITTMKIGHRQEFVSRRTTATVDMHWQASTKNTMRLTAMSGE